VLLMTALLLVWSDATHCPVDQSRPRWRAEAALLAGAWLACAAALFVWGGGQVSIARYLMIPFVLWAALRFGPRGVTMLSLAIAVLAGSLQLHGSTWSDFNGKSSHERNLHLQLELTLMAFFGLVPAIVIGAQRRIADSLRESETRFRQVVENINEVFWLRDIVTNRLVYVSPKFAQIWGRDPRTLFDSSTAWRETIEPEDRERMVNAVESKQAVGTYDETYRIRRPDGAVRWIRDRAFPIAQQGGEVRHIVGVAEDITERKKWEEQILHGQRVEAIGTLASGLAHDLNNILTPVMILSGMLLEEDRSSRDREALGMIESGCRRGADLIRQLLIYSRGDPSEAVAVQLRLLVREMVLFMRETFPRNIQVKEALPGNLWTVRASPTQLHQVILNLCVNARDAMPGGGVLTLSAANLTATEPAPAEPALAAGNYVRLQVRDSGTGIPAEIMGKIFDPFFTTKSAGNGSGLGLATVSGIIKSHHGVIQVLSEPGQGATFNVFLPASGEIGAGTASAPAEPIHRGKGQSVLVVDDEAQIRASMKLLLEQQGYRVATADSGEAGLEKIFELSADLNVVLTDLMMPGMGGVAMIKALRQLDRKLPVIALSGLDQQGLREELSSLGVNLLMKPASPTALLSALSHALAAPVAG
jgi:two-component system cell cycle sensor histidine kinase/response regulator CckA